MISPPKHTLSFPFCSLYEIKMQICSITEKVFQTEHLQSFPKTESAVGSSSDSAARHKTHSEMKYILHFHFLVSSKHITAETGNKINPLNTIWPISNSH